jgi:alpha-glucosidase
MFQEVRFWLDAGVDGLRLDAITTLAHDLELRDNPPRNPGLSDSQLLDEGNNPFNWQELTYTRDQPRTLESLGELRAVVSQYRDRYLIGEVADVDMISVSAKYTRSGVHLHSCYNFELMKLTFGSSSLRDVIERTEAVLGKGWTTWAMSNHDNIRVVTRCGRSVDLQGDEPALAKLLLAALLSFRGGACVYQGEELGLTEADVAFEDLRDPWGIEFWPDFKGRDGCRTPMPWSSQLPYGGFTTAKPWLPIPPAHLALAVNEQERDRSSVLHMFRRFLFWRKKHPALVYGDIAFVQSSEPILAFERSWNGERILCVFNFSNRDASQPVSNAWHSIDGHGFDAGLERENVLLPPFGAWFGAK